MSQRKNIGYAIVDSLYIGNTEFVIGYNPKASSPYVVWECLNHDHYYWAHYANNRAAAERDLLKRAVEARERQDRFEDATKI